MAGTGVSGGIKDNRTGGYMKNIIEKIKEINNAGVYNPLWLEEEINVEGMEEVETTDYEERRWYTTATVVYKYGDKFIGVHGAISFKSESMKYSNIGEKCVAFEMEPVETITYRIKP